ncbi:hypothetical protein NF27_IC00100 [Candidatus Jidaibacter acanthamoeba]|uniref:MPN domain-containing protein n=1 Tax=Candidatus Jidaibacter acanthamoebae TaxID=86105 RepID=A0A0C1MQT8_9RICK|nr:DNA repair protein RadC [Candidatus Jidaibacter acanthamoeba]KIE04392.1 hypothetical protein NF27_IC00100 [Candidatus Jidaibacter acanthamoeba]
MGTNHLKEDKISSLEDYQFIKNLLLQSEGEEASNKARKLINKYGSLSNIIKTEQACIKEYANLNDASALLLKYIKEGIRRSKKEKLDKISVLNNTKIVSEYCRLVFEGNNKEVFAVLYLDQKYKVIQEEFISDGNLESVRVNPKDIVRKALIYRAKGLIVAHNHPSGILLPSREDIKVTSKLFKSLEVFDITLLDHLIINEYNYYSFRANDLIKGEVKKYSLSTNEKLQYIKSLIRISQKYIKKNTEQSNKLPKSIDTNQLAIKQQYKMFKDIGIVICNEWLLTTNEMDSTLISGDRKYDFCQDYSLECFDNSYLKLLNLDSPMFFSYIDKGHKLLFLSKTYENIFNIPCKDIVGKNLRELVGEQGYTICKPFLNKAF